jgi:predicted phosphoribosyltransferase
MRFKNRERAARQLADRLASHRGEGALVVAIPPASIPMARLIADTLDADLDVVLVGELRASSGSSVPLGVVDDSGDISRGPRYDAAPIAGLRDQLRAQVDAIRAQRTIYTHLHPPGAMAGRTVIVVEDGSSGAMKLLAAIRSLRRRGARRIIVAAAVAPRSSVQLLYREADDVVVLNVCGESSTAASFFDDFDEPGPEQVAVALHCPCRWG